MAAYDTLTKTVGNITITLSRPKDATAGDRLVTFLEWLASRPVDPGYGVDEGGQPDTGGPSPGHPDTGGPSPGGPDTGGPSPGRPGQGLPGRPGRPGQLPNDFLRTHAQEIAKFILGDCYGCRGDKPQPK